MKKKFGLFALVLAVLLCGSLFLLAACDETEEDPADTPATISVTVNGTAQTSGGTYSATVGTAYTFAATASNGNAVTISYVFGDAAAEELNGTSFTPTTAGSYAFTFTAEDATSFTLTLVAAEAEVPPATQYTVTYELGEHAATGAQPPTVQTVAENTQVTLPAAVAAAEGYIFGGWNDGTTTYQAGAEYTVTGNVTMTAVWNVVHTHTYTWEVTQVPTDSALGSATGTCSGCEAGTDGHTTTIDLPVLTEADAYTTNVKTHATCTVAEVTTYTYAENTQITFDVTGSVDLSVAGHGTGSLTFTASKAATCVDDACGAYVYCSVCGKYYAVTAGTSLDDPDLAISTDAQDSASAFIDEDTATGHNYTAVTIGYSSGTMSAEVTCDNGCGTPLSLSVPAFDAEDTVTWTFIEEETPPTHTTEGAGTYTCEVTQGDYTVTVTVTGAPIPAVGEHTYSATFDAEGYATALADNGGSYTLTCTYEGCSQQITVTLLALDSEEAGWQLSDQTTATCVNPATATYTCTVQTQDGSASATIIVTGVQTAAALGHSYGTWSVTTEPTTSTTGTATRTCSECDEGTPDHTEELALPVLNGTNYDYAETQEPSCTAAGSATYTYTHTDDTTIVITVTLPQSEHSFTGAEATVDAATGNIIQTCANCPATQTLATLTGLSVGWAEGKQGWYTVGGTINASDFDVTYTYEDDVAAYEDIIKAAITNDITNTDKTATTGIKTVTFTLGGQSASIDVMVYAANETNGAKVLSAQEGTVTTTDGAAAGLTVAKIPEVSTNGLAITFRTVQMRITSTINSSDWDSAAIIGVGTAAGLNVTMPNLQANTYAPFNEQIFPQAANLFNGGVWDSFIRTVGQVVTISIDSTTGISYYSNGVLKVRYAPTDALGGSTVANFITILLGSIETEGFTFAGSGFAADDLYITYALGDSQAAALYNTVLTEVNTGTLLSGINGVTVYDSVAGGVSKYVAGPISGIADQGSTGLSISFRLDALYNAPDTRNWDDIVLGTSVELDVCLGVLEAWANTSASMAGDYNYFTPSTGSATYFRDLQTLGGYLTITLSATEGISYYYDGDLVVQYSTGTQSTQNAEVTVATLVNAIFAEIAVNGFDVCENVSVSDLLITSALTEEQAATLYNNYQSLNA